MKLALAFLAFPLAVLTGLAVWFATTYTVLETSTGGEWLVLKAEQAAECKPGCDVFSVRELAQLLARLMMEQRQPQRPSL